MYEGTAANIPHMMGYTEKIKEKIMSSRLVIDGNAVYEIDEECYNKKQEELRGKKHWKEDCDGLIRRQEEKKAD